MSFAEAGMYGTVIERRDYGLQVMLCGNLHIVTLKPLHFSNSDNGKTTFHSYVKYKL